MDLITDSKDERLQHRDIRVAEHQALRDSLRAALERAEAAEKERDEQEKALVESATLLFQAAERITAYEGEHSNNEILTQQLADARGQLCRAMEIFDALKNSSNDTSDTRLYQLLEKALSSYSPCAHAEAAGRLREAVNIDREDVGRIMHESWTRTKRAQGFHGPGEYCNTAIELDRGQYSEYTTCKVVGDVCPKYHADLISWEKLPEKQKDINRHAFDDVLAELRRRAEGGK